MKVLYHATNMKNLGSILENGIEARNIEKLVYLAETPQDALKFIALRFYPEMLVIKVKIPKKYEHKIIATDITDINIHNIAFAFLIIHFAIALLLFILYSI